MRRRISKNKTASRICRRRVLKSKASSRDIRGGICLAKNHHQMIQELRCDHCEQTVTSNAYRVISEDTEGGGILLDMIVCNPCSKKAQELGLNIEEIDLNDRYLKRG